jgi:hypothetical protein
MRLCKAPLSGLAAKATLPASLSQCQEYDRTPTGFVTRDLLLRASQDSLLSTEHIHTQPMSLPQSDDDDCECDDELADEAAAAANIIASTRVRTVAHWVSTAGGSV